MKLFEWVMARLGWVKWTKLDEVCGIADLAMANWRREMEAHNALRAKVTGIAAMTPEQRSARTAKGNRTRALRRKDGVNSDA